MKLDMTLKSIRKLNSWTQEQLADRVGLKRSLIGAYEEGRAEPKIETLLAFSRLFNMSVDDLLAGQMKGIKSSNVETERLAGKKLRILVVPVDPKTNKESVSLVPIKAAAGYLGGYGDMDFIEALPQFSLPIPEISSEETRRVFQIEGDSMLPFLPGSYLISSYIQDWNYIKTGELYVFLTQDRGVVFKRAKNCIVETGEVELISDNLAYEPYKIHIEDLLEVWKVEGNIQFDLSQKGVSDSVVSRLDVLQREVRALRSVLEKNVA
ncbi:MAG: HTH-type transcriptional regulator Xre [Owenweeksia sp. TMED14]|nr:MAG: HTH-type transcriptional regulator Xre [Owenweeksia sp. TMED14]|tara:strand:+ start:7867 stop:8664 length:798 start_codon:yes stop_codon:yes gene_type:complete